jgi:hypothetical protein
MLDNFLAEKQAADNEQQIQMTSWPSTKNEVSG